MAIISDHVSPVKNVVDDPLISNPDASKLLAAFKSSLINLTVMIDLFGID